MRFPAVGHVDADCFYASAERVRDPYLAAMPVGVLGNQGACVIAKSYEMKARGIKTGEPIWDAVKKCPEGVYAKRDFRWYEVLSRSMLDLVRLASPCVEYYSIDEFFFAAPKEQAQHAATDLRDRIRETAKLPVTVGVARTRTLAKLFSDTAKPFGVRAVLDRDEEQELLSRLPVTEISGIAGRRAARLEPYGIRTCLDLRNADRLLVRQILTRTGEALWYELNGVPVLPLQPQRPAHQVLSRGGSLGGATADPNRLYAWLVRNLERLIEELEFHAVKAGRLTVALAYRDGETAGEGALDAPTDRFDLLLDAGRVALRRAYLPCEPATHMHLIATKLRCGLVQRSLFEPPSDRAEAVAKVKREVNTAVGRFTLRSGATLPLTDVYADPTNAFDVCDIRGKMCF